MSSNSPKLLIPVWAMVGYLVAVAGAGCVVVMSSDGFYRLVAFVLALQLSFFFWTFTTARGERQAQPKPPGARIADS